MTRKLFLNRFETSANPFIRVEALRAYLQVVTSSSLLLDKDELKDEHSASMVEESTFSRQVNFYNILFIIIMILAC